MLSFACGHCGQLVFFENTLCLRCSTPLGFVPERLDLVALEATPPARCIGARTLDAGRVATGSWTGRVGCAGPAS